MGCCTVSLFLASSTDDSSGRSTVGKHGCHWDGSIVGARTPPQATACSYVEKRSWIIQTKVWDGLIMHQMSMETWTRHTCLPWMVEAGSPPRNCSTRSLGGFCNADCSSRCSRCL